jgi:hypothetical protein
MSEKLDQATYEEVKAGQIDGAEATEIAAQLEISVEQVEEIMRSGTYKQYKNGFTPKTTPILSPKVKPAPSESIKRLLGDRYEQDERLEDKRDVLSMQVRGLLCTVKLLESRKWQLEEAISRYDKYLQKALKVLDIDALEDGVVDFSRPNQ